MSPKPEEPWTIGRLLTWTTGFLGRKGSDNPGLDTSVLLAEALRCKRIDLYQRYDEEPSEEQKIRFREMVKQRSEGCPVAYLVGHKDFFSLEFEVNRSVLIPRGDSEWLVVETLRLAKDLPEPTILDLGTGSGNLAICIAKNQPTAKVVAVDLSAEALAVAQRNATKHGVTERITFLHGDLFAPVAVETKFDFIVSNPPYIKHDDIAGLAVGVRDFEPHLALDGGPDGFVVFDRILARALEFLKPGGYLLLEIGSAQEEQGRMRIARVDAMQLAPTILDLAKQPRVLQARRQS